MKNIVLIGMPASGKSTIGVILAKTMGMDFVDTDLLIQKKENKLLQDIITEKGIDSFIQIEEEIILELNCNNHVVATGGSVIYSHKAMEHLKQNGILVYLNTSYDEIKRRLTNITSRGIVFGKEQDLQGLFNERTPLYEKYADIILDCTGKEVEEIVNLIKDKLS
ncbi:MAG TPA: shikimate kinase [Clostridiaceae bacterium]|nr:shikimate kinase [Clostridiaceae bacterium]